LSDPYIQVNEPLFDGNEKKYLMECIDSGWISSEGPFVKEFEKRFAQRVGRRHGVAMSSGTAALDIAMLTSGLKAGDEVIVPAFTIISCVTAILKAGCVPVLVDADPLTWNPDPNLIRAMITRKTRAIMVVHLYGLPADLDPILKVAREFGLKVIEDAAEMHGQDYRGEPCGSFGDVSTFSFYANKLVTTGEGGMLVTDDDSVADHCRSLRNLCFDPRRRFVHEEIGFNYRMTNLQAAVGLAQLERLDTFVIRKRATGRLYHELLHDIPGLQLPLADTDYAENIYWVYGMVHQTRTGSEIIAALHGRGIGSRPFFWPMHEQPVFVRSGMFNGESYPVAERIARHGIYLPSGIGLTDSQIRSVAKETREILR